MTKSDSFALYCEQLVRYGHDRHWIRRNEPALRARHAVDPTPFPPLPAPLEGLRDRYREL